MSPQLLIFDVNETLSDMAPMADRFAEVGASPQLAGTWFAGVLRDGFALTVNGVNPAFAEVASATLRTVLGDESLERSLDEAVEHIVTGLGALRPHPDVVPGIGALADAGIRLVTLSNGSTSIAERLLDEADLADKFERLLSVEGAGRLEAGVGGVPLRPARVPRRRGGRDAGRRTSVGHRRRSASRDRLGVDQQNRRRVPDRVPDADDRG